MIASDLEFFDAVVETLTDEGLLVGYATAPASIPRDAQGRLTKPYVVVYPMPSGGTGGPMSAVNDDEDFVVQITSVGSDPRQALVAATKAKRRLLAGLTVPGREMSRTPSLDVGAGVSRDDDTSGPPLFYAVHRYRFGTTPA